MDPVARFVMTDLPPLGDPARKRMEEWAVLHCTERSFPPGGFTGTLRGPKPHHNAHCWLLTSLKRWGVQKPSGSAWLQLLAPAGSAPAAPAPAAPAKRKLSAGEKKATQRAAKKQRLWEEEERRLFDRAPRELVEHNERVAMLGHDEVEQRRLREHRAMEGEDVLSRRWGEEEKRWRRLVRRLEDA